MNEQCALNNGMSKKHEMITNPKKRGKFRKLLKMKTLEKKEKKFEKVLNWNQRNNKIKNELQCHVVNRK